MNHRPSLRNRLLVVSAMMDEPEPDNNTLDKELSDLATKLMDTRGYPGRLTPAHIKILARLFHKTVSDSGRIEPLNLLNNIYKDLQPALDHLSLIIELIEMGIIDCDQKKYKKIRDRSKKWRHTLDQSSLVDVYVGFTDRFMSFLLDSTAGSFSATALPFKNNLEYLEYWFKYVDAVYQSRVDGFMGEDASIDEGEAISIWDQIQAKTRATGRQFPFQRLCNDYDLSHDEQTLVMFVLRETLDNNTPDEHTLNMLLRHTRYDKFNKPSILTESGTLQREGIIQTVENSHMILGSGDYEIAPDIAAFIISNKKRSQRALLEDIINYQDILSIAGSMKRLTDMVLPTETMNVLRKAISRFKNCNRNRLHEWGLGDADSTNGTPSCNAGARLVMLLYGPPGTGKTTLAHALARSLRRPLLTTDVSRILDKYIGESEKRLSRLFLTYNRIVKRTGQQPVLLLNEADQLISKRGGISQAADRMYNQMQNILLENLESFKGILVATTNMIDNIDDAFSRRFDLKLELERPSAHERKKLWSKLIPAQLPLEENTDFDLLATRYAFTGGQIELVIRNAATAAADRCQGMQVVCQADLIQYADLEQASSFDSMGKKPIGFQ